MFFRVFERLFVIVLLLGSMQVVTALTNPVQSGPNVSGDLNMAAIVVEGTLYLCGALLVLMRWRRVLNAARTVWPLLGLTALAPLSIAWSVNPIETLRRSVLLLTVTTLAIYLGERYSIEKLARLLAQTLCLMMLIVVGMYFVAAGFVIDQRGEWKGVSAYKNCFGEYMAVAVTLLLLVRFRHFDSLRYVFLPTAVVLLVLSHSAGAILCCVLVVAAMPLWHLTHSNRKRRVLVYAMTVLVIFLGIVFMPGIFDQLLHLLGRDSTLTGRTHLWSMVLPAIAKHPILGYGFDAFWIGLRGEALQVWIGTGWMAPRADNGYLELCLGLGLLGLCAFTYVLVHSFRRAMEYVRSEPGRIGLWPITYLCFFVLHNLVESVLLWTFSFLMFAILTTSLAVSCRQRAVAAIRINESQPVMHEWPPPVLSG